MKKYIYGFLISILTMLTLSIIFDYFNFDGDFIVGWLSCMSLYITIDYFDKKGNNV